MVAKRKEIMKENFYNDYRDQYQNVEFEVLGEYWVSQKSDGFKIHEQSGTLKNLPLFHSDKDLKKYSKRPLIRDYGDIAEGKLESIFNHNKIDFYFENEDSEKEEKARDVFQIVLFIEVSTDILSEDYETQYMDLIHYHFYTKEDYLRAWETIHSFSVNERFNKTNQTFRTY